MMSIRNDDTALMFDGNIDVHYFLSIVFSLKSNR